MSAIPSLNFTEGSMADADWGHIYKDIGAQPVINAIGSVTMLGGSTPVPEVQEAMEAAGVAYIPLTELEDKAGRAVAEMVGVPAAWITSGAGSALTLAAAAVMAGDDDDKIEQLPDTTGMKSEFPDPESGSATGTTGASRPPELSSSSSEPTRARLATTSKTP